MQIGAWTFVAAVVGGGGGKEGDVLILQSYLCTAGAHPFVFTVMIFRSRFRGRGLRWLSVGHGANDSQGTESP